MNYRFLPVERFPSDLREGVVYVSEEFEMAALKCACGCGHKVNLLLGDGHIVLDVDGWADIRPSIGVWDAPCRSHFFVRSGKIIWADSWSQSRIDLAMKLQENRHDKSMIVPWYLRLWRKFVGFFRS